MPSLTVVTPVFAEVITAVRTRFICTSTAVSPERARVQAKEDMPIRNSIRSISLLHRTSAFLALLGLLSLPVGASAEGPKVTLSTTQGDIVLELDAEHAPQTVANFLEYVDSDFYTDTLFHRVIEGFMIQGGGFNKQYQKKSTRAPVSNEAYNGLRNRRYTIAMARTTAPHSATSQFFINSEVNTNLDHTDTTQRGWGYTVFGRVIEGEDVVDAISRVRTGAGGPFSRDVPQEPVVILSATRYEPPQQPISAAPLSAAPLNGDADETATAINSDTSASQAISPDNQTTGKPALPAEQN